MCHSRQYHWGALTSESSVPDAVGIASARTGWEYEPVVISASGHPQLNLLGCTAAAPRSCGNLPGTVSIYAT